MELLGELLVVVRLIEAGAEDLDVFRLVVVEEVPEPGTLCRSAGRVRFGEKPQQHFLTAEVAKLDFVPAMIGHLKIRRRIADLQHAPSDPSLLVVLLVIGAAAMFPPGRALDLACGAGRNARYLAERGWRVIAVDLSVAAVRMVGVPVVLADLERHALPFADDTFDLVCIINFLHRPLFAEAQRVGRSVAAAIRTSGHYSLSPDELRSYFAGCRIVVDREGEIIAIKGNEA